FEEALDIFIKAKMEEVQRLQRNKDEVLSELQSVEIGEAVDSSARFTIMEGRNYIYSKILQMISETKSQLLVMSTVQGLVRASQFGLFDAGFNHPLKSKIRFKVLTELTRENFDAAKALLKAKPDAEFIGEARSVNSGLRLIPRLVIRDEEEIVLFISHERDKLPSEAEDAGLWTNSRALVHAFKAFFDELWRGAIDVQKKIVEIETGKPAPETYIIRDAETAHKKFDETLNLAEKEIVMLTSSKGLLRAWKNRSMITDLSRRGVSIRIMAPIIDENLKAARELSKHTSVRHVPICYLRTTIVDGKHLFQFATPPPDQEKLEAMDYFEEAFYSNDSRYVERMSQMLNDLWEGACELSEITLESVARSPALTVKPTDSVSNIARMMTKKDVGAVIVVDNEKPVGILTEKDIISRVITMRKDPDKTLVKDVMSAPLITIDIKQTANMALELMKRHKIRRLAVVRGEKLVGLLTERRALRSHGLLCRWNLGN
ncbi:MAG: CBS domain-containing protein, partial [Candidatus Bathyarchaeia archaeon]